MLLFIYSVLGWLVETIYCRIFEKKWSWRGFFIGPYCPIYGFGSVFVIILLSPFIENPFNLFVLSIIITSVLEYITSYVMEKLFNAKWWDYSQFKFNINGRICLLNSLEFGILSVVLLYFIHPYISKFVLLIPEQTLYIIDVIILIILTVDLTVTLNNLLNFKEKLKTLSEFAEKLKENGNEKLSELAIHKELSMLKEKLFLKGSGIGKRFLNAFPNLNFKNLNAQLQEFKQDLYNYQQQRKEDKKAKKEEKKLNKLKTKNN